MKNKKYIILVALSLLTFSCNEWLDVRPMTEESTDNMFLTYQGYKDALTGCYIKMNQRSLYGENLTMTTTEYMAQLWDFGDDYKPTAAALKNLAYTDEGAKNVIQDIYSKLYNVIVQANSIIQHMPETGEYAILDAKVRAVIEGEAYAIRAYCHLDVLRLFGQPPVNSPSQVNLPYSEGVSIENVKYYNFTDFAARIESDINKALALLENNDYLFSAGFAVLSKMSSSIPAALQDEYMWYRQFRLNYYAVKALQARFYRYTGDAPKALEAALFVINAKDPINTSSALRSMSTTDINSTNKYYGMPTECLFALSNSNLNSYTKTLMQGQPRDNSGSIYIMNDKFPALWSSIPSALKSNRETNIWASRTDEWGNPKYQSKKYAMEELKEGISASELLVYKQLIPMLRLSEMYLIAIESGTDLTAANLLYKTYMNARGFSNTSYTAFTTKEALNEEIFNEYRREFHAEGQMFYTYKRLCKSTMLWRNVPVNPSDYIVPLPSTELLTSN